MSLGSPQAFDFVFLRRVIGRSLLGDQAEVYQETAFDDLRARVYQNRNGLFLYAYRVTCCVVFKVFVLSFPK